MRKILISTLAALSVSGCATTGGLSTDPTGQVATAIADVQAITTQICGFVPLAVTVADILAAGNPALGTAGSIAQAICNAVTPAKLGARKGAAIPTVADVQIHGRFVR